MFSTAPGGPFTRFFLLRHPERSEARAQLKDLSQGMCTPFAQTLAKSLFLCLLLAWHLPSTRAQESKRLPGSVPISFLPPPLEKATYSLGIFDSKTGKLVRQLHTAASEKDFTVGLNGLITTWDGKDDTGKVATPGRYSARGYAIGGIKVAGEETQGNDWSAGDEKLRIACVHRIALVPEDGGLLVLVTMSNRRQQLIRFAGPENDKISWSVPVAFVPNKIPRDMALRDDQILFFAGTTENPFGGTQSRPVDPPSIENIYSLNDGTPVSVHADTSWIKAQEQALAASPETPTEWPDLAEPNAATRGKGDTGWAVGGANGLVQTSFDQKTNQRTTLRRLEVKPGEPPMQEVAPSTKEDRLYLLESMPGWQRVRGLVWLETKKEDGKPVSTWKTFFERSIHQPVPSAVGSKEEPVEINLDENALSPGKPQKIRLIAVFDGKGSYLATDGGLRLRQISERPNLQSVHLGKGKPPSPLEFFQYDGAATDVFSIKGLHNMMAFDAGEFELTANGEKPASPKPTEPPDL